MTIARSSVLQAATLLVVAASASSTLADPPRADASPARPVSASAVVAPAKPKRVLRISADPNNLPFTNDRREGFENKIADLVAKDLGAEIQYTWRAQRRGFFRHAFKEREADLVLAAPVGFDMATTTAPYYTSTYVFVSRKDRPAIQSLDDPALKRLKIGVQLVGDDGVNTPPAHALAARGVIDNVSGFTLYADYQQENPPARLIEAAGRGEIDVAVAWGPMAAYFAKRRTPPLVVAPVKPAVDPVSGLKFTFSIAMAVQKGNKELRDELNAVLKRRKADVGKILDDYDVPQVAPVERASPSGGR